MLRDVREKKDAMVAFKLTKPQKERLEKFCIQNKIKVTDIYTFLTAKILENGSVEKEEFSNYINYLRQAAS